MEKVEARRQATIKLLGALRSQYLKTPSCSPLKHWEQLATRSRAAARTSAGLEEWLTSMCRTLQIDTPDSWVSGAALALQSHLASQRDVDEWLEMVDRENGFLMATLRAEADERKVIVKG